MAFYEMRNTIDQTYQNEKKLATCYVSICVRVFYLQALSLRIDGKQIRGCLLLDTHVLVEVINFRFGLVRESFVLERTMDRSIDRLQRNRGIGTDFGDTLLHFL